MACQWCVIGRGSWPTRYLAISWASAAQALLLSLSISPQPTMPASVEILTKTQLFLWMNVSSLVIFSGERPGTIALLALADAASWANASIWSSPARRPPAPIAAWPRNRRRDIRAAWIDSHISSCQAKRRRERSGVFMDRSSQGLGGHGDFIKATADTLTQGQSDFHE